MSVHRERVFVNIMWGYRKSRNWCFTRTQLKALIGSVIIIVGFMIAVATWSLLKIRENQLIASELVAVKHSLFKLQAAQEDVFSRAYPPRVLEEKSEQKHETTKIPEITDPTIADAGVRVSAETDHQQADLTESHQRDNAGKTTSLVSLEKIVLVRQAGSITLEYDLVNRRNRTVDGYFWLTFKKDDQAIGRLPDRMQWDSKADKPSNYRESWRFRLRNFVHKSVLIPREFEIFDTFEVTITTPDGLISDTLTFRRHEISTVSAEIS